MKQHLTKLAPLFALLLLLTPSVRAEDKQAIEPYEAWFVLNMGGQKAGYMHVTLKQFGGTIVSETQMKLAIQRGQAAMEIEQASRFIETLDYKPLQANASMKMSTLETTQSLQFADEKWKLTTTTAGQATTAESDAPEEEWLTPGALSAMMAAALERGDEEITFSTLDLSTGTTPIAMTMKRGEQADIEVFGKVVPATKWTTTMSAMPGLEIEQWTDEAGQPVRQAIPLMPGMEMEMLLADKELALAEFDAPEMLAASLITPDKPIKNPRTLKRAVFDLIGEDLKNSVGDTVPNDGYQTTEWVDDNTLRVTVDLENPVASNDGKPNDSYLAASSMLNYKDDAIQTLFKEAMLENPPVWGNHPNTAHAEVLRKTVRDHIEAKDLSVGFASASETARTKQGDCTEHGCLLAAMLRGAGIPSRTVTGLVYADQFAGHEGVFGFHMWTQAWIATQDGKGYWLDLDAAAPGDINGFDATHIALSTSAMRDGDTLNDMVTMLPLMQGLTIKVVETEWAE